MVKNCKNCLIIQNFKIVNNVKIVQSRQNSKIVTCFNKLKKPVKSKANVVKSPNRQKGQIHNCQNYH